MRNTGSAEITTLPLLILMNKQNNFKVRMKSEKVVILIPGVRQSVTFQPVNRDVPPGRYQAILTMASRDAPLQPIERTVVIK